MPNEEFRRGEVYWINVSDAVGSEEMMGRPGVIISSDYGNDNVGSVIVAFTTRQQKFGRIYPYIYSTGYKTHVLCNQLRTIDKSRIQSYICTLSKDEMAVVDRGIKEALDLRDDTSKVDAEVERLNTEISERIAEVDRLNVEIELLKRKYNVVLDELVTAKVAEDVRRRCCE